MTRKHFSPGGWHRFLQLTTLACVTAWLFQLGAVIGTVGQPAAGFVYEPNLLVSTVALPDRNPVLKSYDRLVAADGQPLTGWRDLARIVASRPVGTPIRYELDRKGEHLEATVRTTRLGWRRFALAYLMPFVLGAGYLIIGIVTYLARPRSIPAQAHLVMCCEVAIAFSGFDLFIARHLTPGLDLATAMFWGGSFVSLALVFPRPLFGADRHPWMAVLPHLASLALAVATLILYREGTDSRALTTYFGLLAVFSTWAAVGLMTFLVATMVAAWRGGTARTRNQAQVVLLGAIAAYLPYVAIYMLPVALGRHDIPVWSAQILQTALNLFPLSIAYAIARHQLFDIRLVVRRATLYAALLAVLGGLYAMVTAGVDTLVVHAFPQLASGHLAGFVGALAIALAIRPAYEAIRRRVDRLFLGPRADALELLVDLSHRLPAEGEALAQDLVQTLRDAMNASWVYLQGQDQLEARLGPVAGWVAEVPSSAPAGLHVARRLAPAADELSVVLPLVANDERIGLLLLGPKQDDLPYNGEEQAILRVVSAHAATALRAVRLFDERVQAGVETRMSQQLAEDRQDLLFQVVHDLRADLMNIALAVHRLQKHSPEGIDGIQRSLARIDAFLREKAEFAREGRGPVVSLIGQGVVRAIAAVEPLMQARGQVLATERKVADVQIPLSPIELAQVLQNLLTNASQASPEGATITLSIEPSDDEVYFTVQDQGPGVDARAIARYIDGDAAAGRAGHGLGLRNAWTLLDQAGGRLTWRNLATGACFRAALPRVNAVPPLIRTAPLPEG